MRACQDPSTRVKSPNTEAAILTLAALALTLSAYPVNLDLLDPFKEDMLMGAGESALDAAVQAASESAAGLGGQVGGVIDEGAGEATEAAVVLPSAFRQLSQWLNEVRRLL